VNLGGREEIGWIGGEDVVPDEGSDKKVAGDGVDVWGSLIGFLAGRCEFEMRERGGGCPT
jgi:hypothetical protein